MRPAASHHDRALGALWGALVGDALGVPVEFKSRASLKDNPVKGMRGHGTYNQPPGTWSDDGSLLLCSVESLTEHDFDLRDMGQRFLNWMRKGHWSAHGDVFDIGLATTTALMKISNGVPVEECGGREESSNGNGSLMRILPVALRFARQPATRHTEKLQRASSITHAHAIAKMSCAFYGLVIRGIIAGGPPRASIEYARTTFLTLFDKTADLTPFRRILADDFATLSESAVGSSGYVIHTLHASLWCLATTSNYTDCVLRAVNLGEDTDTTACVAGGLAGALYGLESVPPNWLETLPRRPELEAIFNRFVQLPL